jgi:hypothetical protein
MFQAFADNFLFDILTERYVKIAETTGAKNNLRELHLYYADLNK